MLRDVWFEFDSDVLLPESQGKLDEVVRSLKMRENVSVLLSGHTCNLGSESYNLGLSERRANSVKAYLVANGIDPARLSTQGYGESLPIADNSTKTGREENRRVEIQKLDADTCVRPGPGDSTDMHGCALRK